MGFHWSIPSNLIDRRNGEKTAGEAHAQRRLTQIHGIQPKQVRDIKYFLRLAQSASVVKIKKNKSCVKFKLRCPKYLYTYTLKELSKSEKLKQSLPPKLKVIEI